MFGSEYSGEVKSDDGRAGHGTTNRTMFIHFIRQVGWWLAGFATVQLGPVAVASVNEEWTNHATKLTESNNGLYREVEMDDVTGLRLDVDADADGVQSERERRKAETADEWRAR